MRDVFFNIPALMKTEFFHDRLKVQQGLTDRVLRSLRLEDAVYQESRAAEKRLETIEAEGKKVLVSFPSLIRDLFQCFYSIRPVLEEEQKLTTIARKFNRHIIEHLLRSDGFPEIQGICQGYSLSAFKACEEYAAQVYLHINWMLCAANSGKGLLKVLELQEQKQSDRIELLEEWLGQYQTTPTPQLEKKILKIANRAYMKLPQLRALNRMIDDALLASGREIGPVLEGALAAAKNSALEAREIVTAWGEDPGDLRKAPANDVLIERVKQNGGLLMIARYLGRMREMLARKRRNDYAYGRGETYSIERGKDLARLLSSEYQTLASPQTLPLFLRKYQEGELLQYTRRERVFKGMGDRIVCLDESQSTAGENAAWGKALAYVLLEDSMHGKHRFALIHFASSGHFQTDTFEPGKLRMEDVLRSAETFLGGGTDFETPMREAVRLIEKERFHKADILFITDGKCRLPDGFQKELFQKQADYHFTVTGVLLDKAAPGSDFSLQPFCNELYRTSQLTEENIAASLLANRA